MICKMKLVAERWRSMFIYLDPSPVGKRNVGSGSGR